METLRLFFLVLYVNPTNMFVIGVSNKSSYKMLMSSRNRKYPVEISSSFNSACHFYLIPQHSFPTARRSSAQHSATDTNPPARSHDSTVEKIPWCSAYSSTSNTYQVFQVSFKLPREHHSLASSNYN